LAAAVAHARATHGERAYAGHDLALGQVPMAHEPLATVVGQLMKTMQVRQAAQNSKK
jgi:hypothetical protein